MRRFREQYRGTAVEKLELSPRECQTLRLICEGYSTPEIAAEMHIAVNTVKDRVQDLIAFIGVRNRVELVLWTFVHPTALRGITIVSDHPKDCDCGCHCWQRILKDAA